MCVLARYRSPPSLALGAVVGGLVAAVALVALGLDAASVVMGGAVVAASSALVIGAYARPILRGQRAARRIDRAHGARLRKHHARTRKVMRVSERRLYKQLEALAWLRDELDLPVPLPSMGGTAATADVLLELVRAIDRTNAKAVIEAGSGVSTVVMAARLKSTSGGRVFALEHIPEYAEATRAILAEQGLDGFAVVVDAPLEVVHVGGEDRRWYALPSSGLPDEAELLFVDGPPGDTGPLARYPALPLLAGRLAPGAIIIVDDAGRPDEERMVQRWQAEVEGLTAQHLNLTKGACALTMPG